MTVHHAPRVLLIGRTTSKVGPESGPEIVARNLIRELENVAPGLCVAFQPIQWRAILKTARSPSIKIIHYVTSGRIDFLAPLFRYFYKKTLIVTFHGIAPMVARRSMRQRIHYCYFSAMARSALQCAHVIVSVSKLLKDEIAPRYPKAHHSIIHNGLSRIFTQWNLVPSETDGCLKLLMVGSGPPKGLDFVLQALREFTAQYPKRSWTLTIVGVSPQAGILLKEILSEFQSICNYVRIVPKVPHEEMPSVYDEHDAVLVCSSYETFGLALLEAMAVGVPPIVSDRVGSSFLIQDGISGFVVGFGDVGRLASVLDKLSVGVSTLDRKAMRDTALTLTWVHASQQYLKLYEDNLNHSSTGYPPG